MKKLEEGIQLFNQTEYEKAIIVLSEFLLSNPNHADGLFYRGICLRKVNRFNESIEDFNAILIKLPDEPTLLCERAISLFKNQQINLALNDLDRAVILDSKNPFRYTSRAFIRANIDIDGAISDYQKAIELDPSDEIAYNNLGLLQEQRGNYKEAKKSFDKSNQIIGYEPENRLDSSASKVLEEKIDTEKLNTWNIVKGVFTSSKIRNEYFGYIVNFFKN
ncbi:MAG: tetratricopeptide repeat protein [Flavobacteriales bacterium]|nr:tetratricopeptide repeat protein [Flavobacteriales bacterium]